MSDIRFVKKGEDKLKNITGFGVNTNVVKQIELKAKSSFDALQNYISKLNNREYLSADDLKSYKSAMNSYIENNNRLRSLNKTFGQGYTEEQENEWNDTIVSMRDGYKGVSDYFSKFKDKNEYNDAVKLSELYSMSSAEIQPYLDKSEYDAKRKKLVDRQTSIKEQIRKLGASGNRGKGAFKKQGLENELSEINAQIRKLDATSGIAYTTTSGQNITWQSLYDQKKYEEDLNTRYKEYSNEKDWAEKSKYYQNNTKKTAADVSSFFDKDMDWQYEHTANYFPMPNKEDEYHSLQMTDKEKEVFNYIYHTQGEDAAYEWHASIVDILKKRADENYVKAVTKFAEKVPVLSDAASVLANAFAGAEYIGNFLAGNGVKKSNLATFSQTVRGTRAEQVNWEIGNWDAFDFIYNTSMSMADSAISMAAFGNAGSVALGLSAAAQATNDALNRGMNNKLAFWNGLAAGVFEGIFESVSIGQFKALKESLGSGLKNIIKNVAKSMLVNASEETLTEIANITYDTIANGDFSQVETAIRQYVNMGHSESEAKRKVALELGGQVAESAASGALMGFGFGVIGNASAAHNASRYGKYYYGFSQKSVNALVENGLAMPEGSLAYKQAVDADSKLKSGKKLSGTTLYNLATTIESEIETKSETRLSELGVDKSTAKELAPVVAKAVFGERLTSQERETLKSNKTATQVVNELSTDRANTVWKDAMKNSRINNATENNVETEQGEVLQSSADGVVDGVADGEVVQQDGQAVSSVVSSAQGETASAVSGVVGADGKQYSDDGSGDEYFGDVVGVEVAHDGDTSVQGAAVDGGSFDLTEPTQKEIARAPSAQEAIEEAITGKQKNNIQRHITDVCKKLDSNVTVEFVDKLEGNGKFIRSQNKILIRSDLSAVQMYLEVFKHEFMHRLETKQLYSKFFNYCFKKSNAFEQYVRAELKAAGFDVDAETREGVLEAYTKYKFNQYKNDKDIPQKDRDAFTMENAREEIIADFFAQILFQGKQYRARIIEALENADGEALIGIGDEVSSEAALMELQEKETTLFEQVIEWFKDIINRLRGLPQAKSLVEQLDNEIELLESMVRKAYQSKDSKRLMKKKLADEKYSIGEIVDRNNKSYGIGVILDSSRLDSLSPKERIKEVKKYVKSLGGNGFTAYDNNGNIVKITIAKSNDRFKNRKGKSIPVNKDLTNKYINNETKQEAITLIDELVATSKYDNSKPALYSHGWVDNNGSNNWEYWTTYIQDKNNTIWEATLNIANTANGEKILYDITPIKKAGQSIKLDTSSADNSISNSTKNVNTEKNNDKGDDTPSGQYSLGSPIQQMRYNPEAYAKHLNRKYQSKADNDAVAKKIKQIVAQDNKSQKAQEETRQKVYDREGNHVGELTLKERLINEVAVEIAESIAAPRTAQADEVISHLKEKPLVVNEKQEAEIKNQYGTLTNFRKDTGIRVVSETSEIADGLTSLETAWNGDWVSEYPDLFKSDVNDLDMPMRLAEIVDNLNGMTEEIDVQAVAAEVADNLTKTLNETGPKAEKRRVNEAYRKGVADERAKNAKQIKDLQKQNRNLKNRVKPKDVQNIRKEVERIYKKLAANISTKHVHQGLKKAVSEFLELFNQSDEFTFKPADRDKVTRLWREYQKLADTDATSEAFGYDAQIAIDIEMLEEILPGRSIWELHPDELAQIKDIIANVSHCIETVNTMITDGKTEEIATVANDVRMELGHKKGKIFDLGNADLDMKNTTPVYFFERLGSKTMQKLFDAIKAGESIWARNMYKARDKIAEIKQRYGYYKWKDATLKFTTKLGDEIELDLEQAMLLYATVKRERANLSQEAEHTYIGGVVIPTKKVKSLMNQIRGFTKIDGESDTAAKKRYDGLVDSLRKQIDVAPHQIRVSDFAKVSDFLTKQQKAYADEMVAYLSNDMAKLGNEVSMKLFGIEKFNEKYYIPYNSADNFIASMPGVEPSSSIKHRSFTKDLTHGANNPLMLTSFSEVCANHIEQMCMYNAMAIPVDNLTRVMNYKTPGEEGAAPKSVKNDIERVLGKSGLRYINNLIRDMSGSVRVSDMDSIVGKLTGRYKKVAVLASASVIIQQPTSVVRAFKYIPPKYFLKTSLKTAERNYEQMKQYVGEAIIKEMGGFDTGVGATNSEYLLQPKRTAGQVIDDIAGWGANKADQITWAHIWAASKAMVAKQNPELQVGSESFFKKAAEICSETLSKTQVYDSILVKSEAMRSKSPLSKMMTAFMSEPTVTYNMMMSSLRDVAAHKNGAVKALANTCAVIIGQIVVNAAFKSLIYAMRDDDEDETYFEKWLASFVESAASDINYFNYLPYAKDIVSLMQGYSVERMDVAAIADIKQAIEKAFDEDASELDRLKSLCTAFSLVTGVPVKNVWRDAEGVFKTIKAAIEKDYINTLEGTKKAARVGFAEAVDWIPGIEIDTDGSTKLVNELEGNTTYDLLDDANKKKVEDGIGDYLKNSEKFEKGELRSKSKQFEDLYTMRRKYGGNSNKYRKERKKLLDSGIEEKDLELGLEIAKFKYLEQNGITVAEYYAAKTELNRKEGEDKIYDTDGSGGLNTKETKAAINKMKGFDDDEKDVLFDILKP